MTFTPEIYALIREGAQRSAAVIVPRIVGLFHPRSVVDVGCGEGWFAREFARQGVERVLGLDESVGGGTVREDGVEFAYFDATRHSPWPSEERYDLAVCLEVAEHVDPETGGYLVDFLASAAPLVLFSAAIPGQGGHGHLNEQWPAYWQKQFKERGYACTDFLRWELWDDERVEPWYRQNLMVFVALDQAYGVRGLHQILGPAPWDFVDPPAGVVHGGAARVQGRDGNPSGEFVEYGDGPDTSSSGAGVREPRRCGVQCR